LLLQVTFHKPVQLRSQEIMHKKKGNGLHNVPLRSWRIRGALSGGCRFSGGCRHGAFPGRPLRKSGPSGPLHEAGPDITACASKSFSFLGNSFHFSIVCRDFSRSGSLESAGVLKTNATGEDKCLNNCGSGKNDCAREACPFLHIRFSQFLEDYGVGSTHLTKRNHLD
jgi:hypothetical protein